MQKFEPMKSSGKFTKILAGNSADPNNNHLEIFEILSKFSNSDIHIYVILSYGGGLQYINEVKLKGRSLFKDKITFIDDYMSKDEYFDFLKNVDICVFNHYHQQGLGNINLLLCIYKKYISNLLLRLIIITEKWEYIFLILTRFRILHFQTLFTYQRVMQNLTSRKCFKTWIRRQY